jgi:DNA-directed RNA polymerase specialized sigma subunit
MATKAYKKKKAAPAPVPEVVEELEVDDDIEVVVDDADLEVEEEVVIPEPQAPSKTVYLSNKDLLAEVRACKKTGQMSNKLVRQLQLLCSRLGRKGSFVNYSYNEDMQAYAMMMLVRTWQGFNPEKSTNAFAFFTQCIKNSFIQYLKHEERQRNVRDLLMINQGLNPSYGYDDGIDRGMEDERDFDHMRSTLEAQTRHQFIDTPIERDDKGEEIAPVVTRTEDVEDAE